MDHAAPSVAPHCDAPVPLIFLLDEWLRPIGYAVRDVADEIALARGTRKPIRCGNYVAATWHELAIQHANFVFSALGSALRKAANLPSVRTAETPPYRELFEQHWPNIAPALTGTPPLSAKFFAALKLEALRTAERRRKHSASVTNSQGDALPLDKAKPVADKPSAVAVDAPAPESTKPKRVPLTREARETAVADYLREHPGAKIKEVAKGIGAAEGAVSRTAAWQAEMQRRRANRPQRKPLERQLVNPDQSSLLADNHSPLDTVINEEESRNAAWSRLLDLASPKQRAKLHKQDQKEKTALIEWACQGRSDEEIKELLDTLAG